MGRSQKYHVRTRYLYALVFDSGHVYIGQSVDPYEREKQHRRAAGGWCGKPFRLLVLGQIEGTEKDAKEHEHAWRLTASRAGWRIYASPPGIEVNPRRQSGLKRWWLSQSLQWPEPRAAWWRFSVL